MVALGGVLLFHLTYVGPTGYPGIPAAPFAWRHSFGTAVLLITFGYFAASTLDNQPIRQWLRQRLIQLLPAYILAVLAVFVLMRLFAPDDLGSGRPTYGDLVGNLFLLQQLLPNVNAIDESTWIVPVQVAGCVAMALATRRFGPRGHAVVLWSVVLVPLVVDQLWMRHDSPLWLYTLITGTGLLQAHLLVIGIAIWLWSARRMATAHFVLLVAAAFLAEQLEPPPTSILLIALMTGLMCLTVRGPTFTVPGLRGLARPVSWLAGCSYGIYLVHQSIGYLIEERLVMMGAGGWLWVSAPFAVAVVLGWALTVGVQRPALRLLDTGTPWQQLDAAPRPARARTPAARLPRPASRQRVYLHVGLAKTGTTHLQERLWHNRHELAREGLLYPGTTAEDHFRAACLTQPERYPHWIDPASGDVWAQLVARVRHWPATSVLSHELFGSAGADQAREILSALAFAEVHLVCTVRDLARQVPSVWQENLKNGYTVGFPDFVADIAHGDPDNPRDLFWEFQDAPRILRTWAADLPPEHVHVICVPPPGADEDLLWHRFLRTVGVVAPGAMKTVARNNSSLDAAQSELLRRVNRRLREDLPWAQYEAEVKRSLVSGHLRHTPATRPLRLPESARPWVAEHTERCIGDIVARGYDVVGDVDELRPAERAEPFGPDLGPVEVLDVAVDTLVHIIETATPPAPSPGTLHRLRKSFVRRVRSHP